MKQVLFSLITIVSINAIAQNQSIEWTKKIDESIFNQLEFTKIYQSQTNKSFYFNQFYSERFGPDGNPVQYSILTKVSVNGNLEWTKKQDNLRYLDFAITNNELFTLSTPLNQNSSQNFNIYRYNLDGHLISSLPINVTNDITLTSLVLTNDNSYLLAGQKVDSQYEKVKVYLMKLNKKGQKVWEKIIGDADDNAITSISSSKNGDIFFSGYIYNSSQVNPTNLEWTVKLSNKGDIIWSKVTAGIHPEINKVIVTESKDGGCITLSTALDGKAEVNKYDKNGDQQWIKSFDTGYSSVKFNPSNIFEDNNKIVFGGIFESNNESKIEALYLDQNGNLLNNFTLGIKEPSYYMNAILSNTFDEGLSILDKNYNGDINLSKINSKKQDQNIKNITIAPNPATDYINIQPLSGKNTILIKNSIGKEVLKIESNKEKENINISKLQKGIYFISISGESKLENYLLMKK